MFGTTLSNLQFPSFIVYEKLTYKVANSTTVEQWLLMIFLLDNVPVKILNI